MAACARKGEIPLSTTEQSPLAAPARLEALAASGLADPTPEPAYDAVTRSAARLLHAPIAMITAIGPDREAIKSVHGGGLSWEPGEVPITRSFCKHVVMAGAPVLAEDARLHPLLSRDRGLDEERVRAYLGVPVRSPDGHVLGALCVKDGEVHRWTEDDLALLAELGRIVTAEIAARIALARAARAEAAARQRDELLSLAEQSAGIGVWDAELATGMVRGTAQFFCLMGLEPRTEPVPIDLLRSIRHPADRDRVVQGFRQALEQGRDSYESEYRIIRPSDGRERWIFGRGRVLRDAAGTPVRYSGVDIDITERKKAEAALRESEERYRAAAAALARMNDELERRVAERTAALEEEAMRRAEAESRLRQAQKMEAVGQLTGGVAHDFNNLLTVILGSLDMVRRRLGEAGEKAGAELATRLDRSVGMAMQAAQSAAQLTHRLLAFSRQQPLEPKTLDINQLIAGMKELIGGTLGEEVELSTALEPELWRCFVDANQLEIALLNLVVNARDAVPRGGRVTIETQNVELAPNEAAEAELPAGEYVLLAVGDDGIGMSREVLERVFEPFFTTKGPGRGSGLGLSMVYGFVKQSGGQVRIYSRPGEGTCVKIYLPRSKAASEDRSVRLHPPRDQARSAPKARPGETVLVVEDNGGVRSFSVSTLAELGYGVLEASSGPEALRLLDKEPQRRIDLLFTDVVLPEGMDGRQLAEQVLKRRPGLSVLYTTGYTRTAIVQQGRLDAGVELISKPFQIEQLARKVRQMLDRAPRSVESRPALSGE